MPGLHRFTHLLHSLELWIFNNPRKVLSVITILTLAFALRIPGLKIYTDFADLLPQQHPYIELLTGSTGCHESRCGGQPTGVRPPCVSRYENGPGQGATD